MKKIYTYKGVQYTTEKSFRAALRANNILAGSDLDSCADSVETVLDSGEFINVQERTLQDKREVNVDAGDADMVLDRKPLYGRKPTVIELNSTNYQLLVAGKLSGRSSITLVDKDNYQQKLDLESMNEILEGWVEIRERAIHQIEAKENNYLERISTLESGRSEREYLCSYVDDQTIVEVHPYGSDEYTVLGERTNQIAEEDPEFYKEINPFIKMYYDTE